MGVQLLRKDVNTRLEARNEAYHNVAVDVFDDRVVDVLDAIIAIFRVPWLGSLEGYSGS